MPPERRADGVDFRRAMWLAKRRCAAADTRTRADRRPRRQLRAVRLHSPVPHSNEPGGTTWTNDWSPCAKRGTNRPGPAGDCRGIGVLFDRDAAPRGVDCASFYRRSTISGCGARSISGRSTTGSPGDAILRSRTSRSCSVGVCPKLPPMQILPASPTPSAMCEAMRKRSGLEEIGIAEDSALFDLLYPKLCAQISAALQSAIDLGRAPEVVLVFAGLQERELQTRRESGAPAPEDDLTWVDSLMDQSRDRLARCLPTSAAGSVRSWRCASSAAWTTCRASWRAAGCARSTAGRSGSVSSSS